MSGEAAKLEYTTHAVHVMTEREIPVAWVEWVIDETGVARARSERTRGRAVLSQLPGTERPHIARSCQHQRCTLAGGERIL